MNKRRSIALVPAEDASLSHCADHAPFALRVLGDSMQPEFAEGDIIVIEPGGYARDGSYVLALLGDGYTFRQLLQRDAGWVLHALNPAYPDTLIDSLAAVKGVIIQKQKPGSRRSRKSYIE